jgi:cytochrome b involved in lipid metabolism
MGWLTLKRSAQPSSLASAQPKERNQSSTTLHLQGKFGSDTDSTVQHIENLLEAPQGTRSYARSHVPNHKLPFIPASEITAKRSDPDSVSDLWIVIDNIVYDCSAFVHEHPGGDTVIKNFKGSECSWQFWRFHGKEDLEQHGVCLRIGRTSGMSNLYNERPRYVGLKSLGGSMDEW